jgi:hypothetical protein
MKAVVHRLSKLSLKTFKVSYSPSYTNYILNHIATNVQHPLYLSQRRRQTEHKKEGLWWHATNGTDISKSSCVRTWARRRLRQAFTGALKDRGYAENGAFVDKEKLSHRVDIMNVVRLGRNIDLTGSLRIHGMAPLIPAKFEAVKEEIGGIVDALIQGAVDTALGFAGEGEKSSGLGYRSARFNNRPPAHKHAPRKTAPGTMPPAEHSHFRPKRVSASNPPGANSNANQQANHRGESRPEHASSRRARAASAEPVVASPTLRVRKQSLTKNE